MAVAPTEIGSIASQIGGSITPSVGLVIFLMVTAFVGVFISLIYFLWKDSKEWNLTIRVHPENPEVNGINLTDAVIKAKRVRMKDGKTVFYYKKPILGYTISPALTTYTRPLVYDIAVTQDKRIFCIKRVSSIDKQRKELNVEINHPDIEYDMVELQKYNDLLSKNLNYDKWAAITKITGWFLLGVLLIAVIVLVGNYYVEGKEVDRQIGENYLRIQESQGRAMERVEETLTIVTHIIPELQELKGTKNLNIIQQEI